MCASYVAVVSSVYQTRSNVIHSLIASAVYFTLLQALTTFPILFPIHVRFSDSSISPKSMILCLNIFPRQQFNRSLTIMDSYLFIVLDHFLMDCGYAMGSSSSVQSRLMQWPGMFFQITRLTRHTTPILIIHLDSLTFPSTVIIILFEVSVVVP